MAVPVPLVGHHHSKYAPQACSAKQRSALRAISERPDLQTAAERLAEEIEAESVPEETADVGHGIENDAQLQVQLLALQQQVILEYILLYAVPELVSQHTLLSAGFELLFSLEPGLHHLEAA